ncbi:MAG: hypothetical protein IPK07_13740 [Deltaproteobacteria bacterium]|nr:hypothetical protein [Deltaproteobacteria bacterium]
MRTVQFRSVVPMVMAFAVVVVALAVPRVARAEKLVLACQEDDIKGGPTAPPLVQTIVIETGGSPSVQVKAPYGTLELPARVVANDVGTHVTAAGAAKARMPMRKDVDACLAKEKPPAPGQPLDAWAAQTCRLHAASTPEPVAVEVSVDITILEGDVTATVERSYAGDDRAAAERYAMPSRPTCKVESRK